MGVHALCSDVAGIGWVGGSHERLPLSVPSKMHIFTDNLFSKLNVVVCVVVCGCVVKKCIIPLCLLLGCLVIYLLWI